MESRVAETRTEPQSSSMGNINEAFHRLYSEKKQEIQRKVDEGQILILCRMDSRLIVKSGAETEEFVINGDHYHTLKALAHSSLAAFYLVTQSTSDLNRNTIHQWLDNIEKEAPRDIGQRMAATTREFLSAVKPGQDISHKVVSEYQRELEPVFAELLMLSAKDELHTLVEILDDIQRRYDYASSEMFLVTLGGHQPRYKELSTLVFTHWFKSQFSHVVNTDHYVRYCEGGSSLDDAVNLVVTAITDRQLSTSMLGSAVSLNQDVLGIVAEKAIAEFWPEKK